MALAKPATKAAQRSSRSSATASTPAPTSTLTLADAVTRWTTHLHASDKIGSLRTIAAYLYGLSKLTDHLGSLTPLEGIEAEHIESLMAELKASGMNEGGRSVIYRPIKTFFRWCVTRKLLTESPVALVAAPKPKVQPIVFVTDAEFAAVLATTTTRSRWAFRARRDRAILLMLATTGARLSEIANLDQSSIDLAAGTFTVHGKGGKDRTLPLLPEPLEALTAYLRMERPRSPFSGVTEALWLAPRGELSSSGIAQLVAERGKAAGLKRRVHPHELRHRIVAKALSGGMPGPLVMALSGHSTPSMLNRYGAHTRSEDAMAFLRGMAAKG